jgi:hypothetical protein
VDPNKPGAAVTIEKETQVKQPAVELAPAPVPIQEIIATASTPNPTADQQYSREWDESGPIQRPQLVELVRLKKILEDAGVLRPDKWFDNVAYFLDKAGKPVQKATELTTKQGETFIAVLNANIKKHDITPF